MAQFVEAFCLENDVYHVMGNLHTKFEHVVTFRSGLIKARVERTEGRTGGRAAMQDSAS